MVSKCITLFSTFGRLVVKVSVIPLQIEFCTLYMCLQRILMQYIKEEIYLESKAPRLARHFPAGVVEFYRFLNVEV